MTQINLLPWRENQRKYEKKQFIILLIAAVISGIGIVAAFNYYSTHLLDVQTRRHDRLEKEIMLLDKQLMTLNKLKTTRQELIARMSIVQNLQARRVLTVHLFDELIKLMPDGVYLTQLKQNNDRVTLRGYSESNSAVSILLRNMEKNPWVQEPLLSGIKKNKEARRTDSNHLKTDNNTENTNEFQLSFTFKSSDKLNLKP